MRGLHLLSGGIDSPVALFILLKKSEVLDMDAVYFDGGRYGGDCEKVKEIMKHLHEITGRGMRLYIISHEKNHEEFMKCVRRYHCILCKRMMMRVASEICKEHKMDFISTGESLGQVASQTLQNMVAIQSASSYPVVRPLISMDKTEIEKIGKIIGTYEISVKRAVVCRAVPRHPKIKCSLREIEREEGKMDIEQMVEDCLSTLALEYFR